MPTLYIAEQGATVKLENDGLWVDDPDLPPTRVPIGQIDALVLLGHVHLTTPVVRRLLREGIDTVFLTQHGDYWGRRAGPLSPAGELRRAQYATSLDAAAGLALARACVDGKLRNMRTFLLRYQRTYAGEVDASLDTPAPESPAAGEIAKAAVQIEQRLADVAVCTGKMALMGLEGAGSAAYFAALPWLLKHDWNFAKRIRRPPTDPVNVLLSFGYTLLARQMESALNIVGLDPFIGFLHEPAPGRPALALDLMEEFRCIVADSVVVRCLNSGLIGPEDFVADPSPDAERPLVLSPRGVKRFLAEFDARLSTEIAHPDLGERASYRRVFELQARQLARGVRAFVPAIHSSAADESAPLPVLSPALYKPFLVR